MTHPPEPGSPSEQSGAGVGLQPGELRLSSAVRGDALVLAAVGEVDHATAPRLQAAAEQAVATHPALLVLDLSGVGFLASAGLTVLVGVHQLGEPAVPTRVVASGRATLRPIQLTGLDQKLNVFPSLEEALA